jgi:hypothetical protein
MRAILRPFAIGAWIAAGLAMLLASGTAIAALRLVLDRDSGPPGTRVTGQTGGNGAFPTQVDPLSTYQPE